MRNGKTYKRHRTAISCHHRREQSGDQQKKETQSFHVDTEVLGITLTEQQGVEGFG